MLRLLPILAAALVLADGVLTYRALRSGAREANPIRRGLIRAFGIPGGTIGVALVAAVALALFWPVAVRNGYQTAIFSYLAVSLAFGWAAYGNYKQSR